MSDDITFSATFTLSTTHRVSGEFGVRPVYNEQTTHRLEISGSPDAVEAINEMIALLAASRQRIVDRRRLAELHAAIEATGLSMTGRFRIVPESPAWDADEAVERAQTKIAKAFSMCSTKCNEERGHTFLLGCQFKGDPQSTVNDSNKGNACSSPCSPEEGHTYQKGCARGPEEKRDTNSRCSVECAEAHTYDMGCTLLGSKRKKEKPNKRLGIGQVRVTGGILPIEKDTDDDEEKLNEPGF